MYFSIRLECGRCTKQAHRMSITRGGGARRVVVASVRRGGLADKASGEVPSFELWHSAVQAGIKSGDLLVSINGKKAWSSRV